MHNLKLRTCLNDTKHLNKKKLQYSSVIQEKNQTYEINNTYFKLIVPSIRKILGKQIEKIIISHLIIIIMNKTLLLRFYKHTRLVILDPLVLFFEFIPE